MRWCSGFQSLPYDKWVSLVDCPSQSPVAISHVVTPKEMKVVMERVKPPLALNQGKEGKKSVERDREREWIVQALAYLF